MPLSVVPAEEVSGLVPFQPELVNSAAQGHLENAVKGCIKQCGREAMLSCGSLLRGYDTQTGRPYMELQVGRQERPLVGPFVELVRGRSTYLVVAVSGGSGGPLLCVCQPVSGRVVRAIRLAAPVTHLCLVSAQKLGVLGGGCVALATEDRRLLLVDLCLDSARHYSDELRPANWCSWRESSPTSCQTSLPPMGLLCTALCPSATWMTLPTWMKWQCQMATWR